MFGQTKNKQEADLQIYTIYDSKTESYEDPRLAVNDADITRFLVNLFRDPRNANYKHLLNAEDYAIFRIGSYSRKTGTIESTNPTHVVNLHELRAAAGALPPIVREPEPMPAPEPLKEARGTSEEQAQDPLQ